MMRLPASVRHWLSLLPEIRARAIHIEQKLDALMVQREAPPAAPPSGFAGHADQRYGHLTYSQHGEDLVLVSLFERLGVARPSYLDIGAHHPLNCSNTALIHARGGRGVNVDANPELLAEFRRLRPDDINLNLGVAGREGRLTFYCIDATSGRNSFSREAAERFVAEHPEFSITAEIEVAVTTLDRLVAEHCGGRYPDLLSLDAEGLDEEILAAADFATTRPRLICVEVDSAAGQRQSVIVNLLRDKGFMPQVAMGANVIFAAGEDAARLGFG